MGLKSTWDKVSGFDITEAELLQMSLWSGDSSFIERSNKTHDAPYSQHSEEEQEKEHFEQLVMHIILTMQDRINELNNKIQSLLDKIYKQEAGLREQAQDKQSRIDENSVKMEQMTEDIDFINEIIEEVKNNAGTFENAQDRDALLTILKRNNVQVSATMKTPELIEKGIESIKQIAESRKDLSDENDKLEETRDKLTEEADILRDNAKRIEKDWKTRIKNLPPEEQVRELQKIADELGKLSEDSLQKVKEITKDQDLAKTANKADYINFDKKIEVSDFTM